MCVCVCAYLRLKSSVSGLRTPWTRLLECMRLTSSTSPMASDAKQRSLDHSSDIYVGRDHSVTPRNGSQTAFKKNLVLINSSQALEGSLDLVSEQ